MATLRSPSEIVVGDRTLADLLAGHVRGRKANLRGANLRRADLRGAKLRGADLSGAKLSGAYLHKADLGRANLSGADLGRADLSGANLSGAYLVFADFDGSNLRLADLSGAILIGANLRGADLSGANLTSAHSGGTQWATSLTDVRGLDGLHHDSPAYVPTSTLRSQGLPDAFLKGCGLGDWEIIAAKLWSGSLRDDEIANIATELASTRIGAPIKPLSLFESYSHADGAFLDALERLFDERGIRYWRDVHDIVAGRVDDQVERAISFQLAILIVLSEHSVRSGWVEHEVTKALELGVHLCPVALDDAWETARWSGPVTTQLRKWAVLDFSKWRDERALGIAFERLVSGLKRFYAGEESDPAAT